MYNSGFLQYACESPTRRQGTMVSRTLTIIARVPIAASPHGQLPYTSTDHFELPCTSCINPTLAACRSPPKPFVPLNHLFLIHNSDPITKPPFHTTYEHLLALNTQKLSFYSASHRWWVTTFSLHLGRAYSNQLFTGRLVD